MSRYHLYFWYPFDLCNWELSVRKFATGTTWYSVGPLTLAVRRWVP